MATSRSDVAGQIKQMLPMQEVAERYGFHPSRSGFIQCPFHAGDNQGSLKIYSGTGGWHCFGCGAGGSVIDFVMKLFDLGFRQAVLRINMDFGLNLIGCSQPISRAEQSSILEARRREEERKAKLEQIYRQRAEEHRYWWDIKKHFAPAPGDTVLHPFYAEALRMLPILEYWLDENLGR